jgi:hypothetical protein
MLCPPAGVTVVEVVEEALDAQPADGRADT